MTGERTPGDPLADGPGAEENVTRPQLLGSQWRVLQGHSGGMGEVYICEPVAGDVAPGVRVALKTYPRRMLLNATVRRAFARETAIWARLSLLPGVVPVFGIEHIEGRPFVISLAVPPDENGDVSVRDLLRRSALPPERALDIAWQTAATLAGLDRAVPGLVHGDLKPENLLLFAGITVYIADFGLSRGVVEAFGDDRLLATSAYLAPEARGIGRPVDVAGDVYAFGVMLRELLGEPTGDGSGPVVVGRPNVVDQADRAETRLRRALAELAQWCTETDPERRPTDFGLIARRLAQTAAAESVNALGERFLDFAANSEVRSTMLRFALPGVIRMLLSQQMPELALDLMADIRPEEWDVGLWTLHGSALSVAGRDAEALNSFERAETLLGGEPREAHSRTWIDLANEWSLSLTKVGRYQEAIERLTQVIGFASGDELTRTAANLAGTFISSGNHVAAVDLMERLAAEGRGENDGDLWNQLSCAYQAADQPRKAITALRRGIIAAPGDFQLRLRLARLLMEFDQDVSAAAPMLDLALELATDFNEEAVLLRILCALVERDSAKAAELHALVTQQCGAQEADRLLDRAMRALRPPSPSSSAGRLTPHASSGPVSEPPEQRTAGQPDIGLGPLTEHHPSGSLPPAYLNVRFGTDRFSSVDFYHDVLDPRFARLFHERLQQLIYQLPLSLELRASPFFFAECRSCHALIMSNHAGSSPLCCRRCGADVPLDPVHRDPTDAILTEVDRVLGRESRLAVAQLVLVLVEPHDTERLGEVAELCRAAGFEPLPANDPKELWLRIVNQSRQLADNHPLRVYAARIYPHGAAAGLTGSTPPDVQDLISTLRRRIGLTHSMSTVVELRPDDLLALILTKDIAAAEAVLRRKPRDAEAAAGWVILAHFSQVAGDLDSAARQARQAVQLAPDDAGGWSALGSALLASSRVVGALESLSTAQRLDPADPKTAASLAVCHHLIGDDAQARAQADRAVALGHPESEAFALLRGTGLAAPDGGT